MATWNIRTERDNSTILSGKYTANELCSILKRSRSTIYTWAKELNAILPSPHHNRKYQVNENFFDKWTKESCYVAGFIAADGCIKLGPRNGGSVILNLSIRDLSHLEKIKVLLDSSHPIVIQSVRKENDTARITVGSRILAETLINIGITEKKSLTLKWIDNLPNDLVHHFIRGYIDGDGCIQLFHSNYWTYLQCYAQGTHNFILGIKQAYNMACNNTDGQIYQDGKIYKLVFGGCDLPVRFLDWVYQDSSPETRLTRKYDTYINYKKDFHRVNYYGSNTWKNNISLGLKNANISTLHVV